MSLRAHASKRPSAAPWGQNEFDAIYGTDTTDEVEVNALGIDGPSVIHAIRYAHSPTREFVSIMDSLPIRYEDYTFVDLGSGKGLTLFLAAQWPFERIIGVELSERLHRVAEANLQIFSRRSNGGENISLILADAGEYEMPAVPLIVYMYNPFGDRILAKVVRRLEMLVQERGVRVYVVYRNAKSQQAFDRNETFSEVSSHGRGQAVLYVGRRKSD